MDSKSTFGLCIMSLVGYTMIFCLLIHSLDRFYKLFNARSIKSKIGIPTVVVTILCLIFAQIYLLNQFIMLVIKLLDINSSITSHSNNLSLYWLFNHIVYKVTKILMHNFFLARYVLGIYVMSTLEPRKPFDKIDAK